MKQKAKKVLSFVMTLVLSIGLFSSAASAATTDGYYNSADSLKWDFYQNSSVKTNSAVSVKIGTTELAYDSSAKTGSSVSTTGAAVANKIYVTAAAGYRIAAYKIVCGDKYSCRTDSQGNATKVTFAEGNYQSTLVIDAQPSDFSHSSRKTPYWLLLDVVRVAEKYDVTYNLGQAGTFDFAGLTAPEGEKDQLYNTQITTKSISDAVIAAADSVGYEFDKWIITDEKGNYPDGSLIAPGNSFSLLSDTTLTATWKMKDYTLTVNYVDEDGNKLEDSDVTTGLHIGDASTISPKDIDGYYTDTEAYEFIMEEKDAEVNIVYYAEEEIPEDPTPLDPGKPTPTPSNPEKPENPVEEIVDIPEDPVPMTGDSSNMGIYAMILMISIISMAGVIVLKKKRFN